MIKKIFLTGSALLSFTLIFAQNDMDALRVSQNYYGGTARFQSMGGAFGALGGDFSSLTTNPAGLGVYRSSELVFTPTLMHNTTESSYLGTTSEDFEYNFNINNLGYILHIDLNSSGWKGFNFGFGFNRINNFHQNTIIETPRAEGSLLDEFVLVANDDLGIPPSHFHESVALGASGIFLHNPYTDEVFSGPYNEDSNPFGLTEDEIETVYLFDSLIYSNVFNVYADDEASLIYGQLLRKTFYNQGKLGEFVFSAAGNYNHKLYLGATFGIQRLYYESSISHYENNDGSDFLQEYVPIDELNINYFEFKENTITSGIGVNFKMGIIYRPLDFLRLGLAFHSPTVQFLETEFSTKMETYFYNSNFDVSRRSDLGVNEFKVYTPSKLLGSLGFQFQKIALFSIEYEYMNYDNMRIKSDYDNFSDINNDISDIYKSVHNIRGGAEFRFGNFSLRGGLAYYDNPYDESNEVEIKSIFYTGGIGINYKAVKFDVGYVRANSETQLAPYLTSEFANITSTTNRFVTTIAFRF